MPNTLQIIEFEFEARAEIDLSAIKDRDDNYSEPHLRDDNHKAIPQLNKDSDKIAKAIQQEIRHALPPRFRVEAEIQFYEGSIIALGTVILLFLHPIITEAGRTVLTKTFEEGFTRVIKFAIRRVLSRELRNYTTISGLDVDITPQATSIPTDSSAPTVIQTNPIKTPLYLMSLTLANTILLLILITIIIFGSLAIISSIRHLHLI